jgi:hypothetical protein
MQYKFKLLLKLDSDGFCTEINSPSNQLIMSYYSSSSLYSMKSDTTIRDSSVIDIADLNDFDCIEVRHIANCSVGGKFRLSSIASQNKFNSSMRSKINTLSNHYYGYRKIRGDGNCYYRAIIFGLLEQLIEHGNPIGFSKIHSLLTKVTYKEVMHNRAHENLLFALLRASGK